MPARRILIGSTTRYIAGRNAVQTVYWKEASKSNQRLLKLSKTCSFGENATSPPQKVKELQQVKFF